MLHLLGFLFIIIIAVVVIGLSIIGSVVRSILRWGRPRSSSASGTHSGHGDRQADDARQAEIQPEKEDSRPGHKKFFSKDEGEYVDFEEIEE
ncbi:DUF4834 family protein [Bacteroides sp. KG68]|uniref:DUF4834 family protein n=1 Tax=unclassified Bacteroides TaxID=2646097 RepID=UPI003D800162|nr:DUF4834 family protein [Bacteroides sp.]